MTEKQRTILLADDDIDFLAQIRLVLEHAGYAVTTAQSQKEAEELLETLKPDLAIVDLMMEHYDSGFILSYRIKRKYPEVPVIMATAVTSETGVRFDTGTPDERSWSKADLIMDKGIRHDQLLREVHRLLKDG